MHKHTLRTRTLLTTIALLFLMSSSITLFAQNPQPPAYFKQQQVVGAGIGFGGGLGGPGIAYDLLPGYTGTVTPGIMLTYELHFDKHFGVGAVLSFSSATYTNNNMVYYYDSAGTTKSHPFTDKQSSTFIGLAGKAYYHFGAKGKFDPYATIIAGYTFTASSSKTTFNSITYPSSSFFPGVLLGVTVGARVFVSKQIGIWAEAGYSGVPDYLFNAGVVYNITSKY